MVVKFRRKKNREHQRIFQEFQVGIPSEDRVASSLCMTDQWNILKDCAFL